MPFLSSFPNLPAFLSRILFTLCLLASISGGETLKVDVCVYGGTSGGVTAAVQAARLGNSVVLLEPGRHVGGMTSGGLGWTDHGNKTSIQGLSREFYARVGDVYRPGSGHLGWTFEPRVAEKVFEDMLAEAGVPVRRGARLGEVRMAGQRLAALLTENGDRIEAAMYIDCTYEGDLMAAAGVTYTVGREDNSQFGETLNGARSGTGAGNQLPRGIDPYVVPGEPGSGLIAGVDPAPPGAVGSGDTRVQAYCYRMCLTDKAENRIPIEKPEGYNEADYEILFRAVEVGQKDKFWKLSPMPGSKTDSNNSSGISCDFIGGGSDAWAEAGYAERERIARAHEAWQRGLVWTVQNHPRIPEEIRKRWSRWGLPKDEFTDTGHWPHQLYVREARRMVSDYVMLQQDCQGKRVAEDSVGLASYTMDSHHVRRLVWKGQVQNEGDVQVRVPRPYPISYRSIVPREGECENLFVTFALSASHIGFGSCRMEPVFMMTSQSAAIAARLAIERDLPVQQVPYADLRPRLEEAGMMLTWVEPDKK